MNFLLSAIKDGKSLSVNELLKNRNVYNGVNGSIIFENDKRSNSSIDFYRFERKKGLKKF